MIGELEKHVCDFARCRWCVACFTGVEERETPPLPTKTYTHPPLTPPPPRRRYCALICTQTSCTGDGHTYSRISSNPGSWFWWLLLLVAAAAEVLMHLAKRGSTPWGVARLQLCKRHCIIVMTV